MKRFVFLDLETTGLDERTCAPIELAVVVTNEQLGELGSCESLIQPWDGFAWEAGALEMHGRSGLVDDVIRHGVPLADAAAWLSERLAEFREPDTMLHLAGNSVHFDRRFLRRYFPDVERLLHHRHLDVSSVRMLAEVAGKPAPKSETRHRAMPDARDSLEDARRFLGVLR